MTFSRTTKNKTTGNSVYWLPEIELRGFRVRSDNPIEWSAVLGCLAVEIFEGFAKITTPNGSVSVSNSFWRWV